MKLFIYEHITGCGLLRQERADTLPSSLLREGRAMVEAVAADLARSTGAKVSLLCDQRVTLDAPMCEVINVDCAESAALAFHRLAAEADWTLVIAPESDGALLERCRRVEQVGGRLLGPSAALVELCSDKDATAEHLAAAGVPTTNGVPLALGDSFPAAFPYPAVLKPRDGCGSQRIQLIAGAQDAAAIGPALWPARLEQFCHGTAASVAVLCGPNESRALVPCRQQLSSDGLFRYLGGMLPLPPDLAQRATALALRAVHSLPNPRGYIGVDLVLGESDSDIDARSRVQGDSPILVPQKLGQSPIDVVIEINPRLTTSYVGLRAACRGNLAEAMLKISAGEPAELSFRDDPLQFDADGSVRFSGEPWA